MSRTINVVGNGRVSLKPDMINLMITLENKEDEYEAAVRGSAEGKAEIDELICELGFEKKDLKTQYFKIDTVYENYQDKDFSWKNRLTGYRYIHRMKLEFALDNELLGKILFRLSRCKGQPNFTIVYTVKNPEAAKNELLTRAITDSRNKAEILARAAAVELGEIQTIDYSWDEMAFESRPVNQMMVPKRCASYAADESLNIDIEAEDIIANDTVRVVWEIK